ncbi:hypothetical protein, variant [Capsaspora owczarzaki ATCC 30864]|nr:hypothetical protein, variant [Capsaspora owczarzaki ATCC 30864]
MKLFQQQRLKNQGSVRLAMKQHTPYISKRRLRAAGVAAPTEEPAPGCLVRASLGNRKISALINSRDLSKFHVDFGNVIKASMDSLKKKDKKANKKTAAAAAAAAAPAASSGKSKSKQSKPAANTATPMQS